MLSFLFALMTIITIHLYRLLKGQQSLYTSEPDTFLLAWSMITLVLS